MSKPKFPMMVKRGHTIVKIYLTPSRGFEAFTVVSYLGKKRAYADARRLEVMKAGLRRGDSVTRAMVDAGYSSSSRLYERAASQLGMAPRQERKQAGDG